MARPATGRIDEAKLKDGDVSFSMRVPYDGDRPQIRLGKASEGWTRQKAEQHLKDTMAAIRIGRWAPPKPAQPVAVNQDPTFHEYVSDWWEDNKGGWAPRTVDAYWHEITNYLLPFFKDYRLSEIKVREVKKFRAWMLKRDIVRHPNSKMPSRKLDPVTTNSAITRLAQILESAIEDELIETNPARGKKRKAKVPPKPPIYLDSALHISALIEACDLCDQAAGAGNRVTIGRRPMVATLLLAGLRNTELCQLVWRDIDLANCRIKVGTIVAGVKTGASNREVDIHPLLRDELAAWKATTPYSGADDPVFPTKTGKVRNKEDVAKPMKVVVAKADAMLQARGQQPLPLGVTPHKLRHTFASWLAQVFRDPYYVQDQLGHEDPRFTLRVYTHAMKRGPQERQELIDLIGITTAPAWAPGSAPVAPPTPPTAPMVPVGNRQGIVRNVPKGRQRSGMRRP